MNSQINTFILAFSIGFGLAICLIVGFSASQEMNDMQAGFCYGKEGIQIYPYAEIINTYQKQRYDMNLTKKINCSVKIGE